MLTLLILCGSLVAAPPKLTIPAEAKPVGGYVRFTPETDAVSVVYVSLDGLDPFPSEELKDGRRFLLPTNGVADGKYRFAAVAASKDGEQARADFVVVIGTGKPIVDPPKEPGNPTDPPVTPSAGYYFMAVRPDGAASPEFTRVMELPAWKELAKRGHEYKDKTLSEAAALGLRLPNGTTLPTIIVLKKSADGKTSKVIGDPVRFPTSESAILDLPKAVS